MMETELFCTTYKLFEIIMIICFSSSHFRYFNKDKVYYNAKLIDSLNHCIEYYKNV